MEVRQEIVSWKAWWAVILLFFAYTLSFIDRTIISLLVEPMRADLGLTDTQISLLQGLAFTIFYTTMSIPIAFLADRGQRPLIIGIGMFVWSAMTAACGLAVNFVQLFLARMGVGVGEATLGPAAYSLIADLFPPERRGRAMAVFSSGISVGAGLAFLVGGFVIQLVNTNALSIPMLEGLASWQLVFIIVGVPGMFGAFLMLTVPEPRKGNRNQPLQPPRLALDPILPFLRTNLSEVTALFSTFAISGLIFIALLSWGPTFLIREFGATPSEAGKLMGAGLVIAGPLGAFAGGYLSDRGAAGARQDAPFLVALAGISLMSLAAMAALFAPGVVSAGIWLSVALLFGSFAYPAGAAAVQQLAPDRLRARFAAVYLFATTLIAATLGPTIVALFTDFVFGDPALIGLALAATTACVAPLGILAALLGVRNVKHRTEAAERSAE